MNSLKRKTSIAFAWDFSGVIIAKSSGFIISIFLARLLSPEDFGIVGMAAVFIAASQVFIDVGFSAALVQRKDNSSLTYSSVFYFNIFAGFVLTIFMYYFASFVGEYYKKEILVDIVRWLSISFVLNSFNQVQIAILKRDLNFRVLTIRDLIASVMSGVIGIVAAFNELGVYALVIQSLLGGFLRTVLLWSASSWRPSLEFSFKEIKSLTSFSAYVFFDRLVSTIFRKLDILLIAKVFSPTILGYYTRAVSLKDQVSIISSTSLQKVFFPVLSSIQEDHDRYSKTYFKLFSFVTVVSFFLTGILYILGSEIIIGLFGSKWEPSIPMFEVLVLGVCTYPLNAIIINAYMSKGLSKENFKLGVIRKLIQLIPLAIAFKGMMYEFTISLVIVSYFLTVLNIYYIDRLIKLSLRTHLIRLFDGLIPLIPFVIIHKIFHFESLFQKLGFILIFIIVYLGYNFARRNEGIIFALKSIKEILNKRKID